MNLKSLFSSILLFSSVQAQSSEAPAAIEVGKKAPDFTLKDENEKEVSLSQMSGKNIVLVFSRAHW